MQAQAKSEEGQTLAEYGTSTQEEVAQIFEAAERLAALEGVLAEGGFDAEDPSRLEEQLVEAGTAVEALSQLGDENTTLKGRVAATIVGGAFALNWAGLTMWERAFESKTLRQVVLYAAPVLTVVFFLAAGRAFSVPTTSIVRKQIQNLRTGEADERAVAKIEWPSQNLESNLQGLRMARAQRREPCGVPVRSL